MNSTETTCGLFGPVREPILQIHPSWWCNLRCKHCYSESSPWSREQLDHQLVCNAISDAAELGCKVVSFSGGEPLLYRGLSPVLRHAKSLGLRTAVTTNGYFLQTERLADLDGCVDLLAVSVDGPPAVHNEVRGAKQAFERMQAGLENLRGAGFNFGILHTATQTSWEQLPWLGEFAAAAGARLLQVHPLELAGRAKAEMNSLSPDAETLAKIYLLCFALAGKYEGNMRVQCDLLHREHAIEAPGLVYAAEPQESLEVSILVLQPDGWLVPVSYGFSRRYAVCDLKQTSLSAGWADFKARRYKDFRQLCQEVFDYVCSRQGPSLFNWHELIVAASHGQLASHN
ncbi:MAG TPA: radical SAM protein [Candidatus Angelobacter sp.]|nr:radical SAM protein [Candidatus Angelobacter sp.]